jgi:hypothetical protein
MNPVLDSIFRDLAHGTAASALPAAPVVPHVPRRSTILRGQVGAALHRVARRVEPQATRRAEAATCRTA